MDSKILYAAFLTSIAGLIILTYMSFVLEPPCCSISSINTKSLGKNVHICGTIDSIHITEGGSYILQVSDEDSFIKVYIWSKVLTDKIIKYPRINFNRTGNYLDITIHNDTNYIRLFAQSPDMADIEIKKDYRFAKKIISGEGNISDIEIVRKFTPEKIVIKFYDNTGAKYEIGIPQEEGGGYSAGLSKVAAGYIDVIGAVEVYESEIEIKAEKVSVVEEC